MEEFRAAGEPVISVDAKKKELIGNFTPAGRQWRPVLGIREHDPSTGPTAVGGNVLDQCR